MAHFDVGDGHTGGGGAAFKGTLSNLRFTVGAARYGSGTTFTVPTSTLTNDSSNVKLLAFTTSTITADASTAAVSGSITVGDPVFSLDNPFSITLGNDNSGNDNDFTSTNLSPRDVVPDSPTNNFATWNPLDKYNYNAPTEGALRALTAGNNGTQNSTFAVSSGKWYWEARNQSAHSGSMVRLIGIAKEDTNITSTPYSNSDCYLYYGSGDKYNGSSASYGDSWGADGDIIGVAFDADNGAIWFSKNGTWQNSATASEIAAGTTTNAAFTGISGTYVMMVSKTGGSSSNDGHHANFGQDSSFAGNTTAGGNADGNGVGDFKYAPPSGFLALCTSNLPEPEIIDGTDHFNTVLYVGDGNSTKSVSGLGLLPDLVWIKQRTDASNHKLFDSVRGATKELETSTTDEEATQTNMLTSFDADGFTVGNSNAVNGSGDGIVAWNWLAGGAEPAQTYAVTVSGDSGANKYRFDGNTTDAPTLNLQEGGTYTFDQSDSSNSGHPLRFSTTSDGTHGSGSEYTTGVTTTGTPGNAGAKTVITVAASAATLYYYCSQHSGMGGQANTNSTRGSTNLKGNQLSTVSANTTAGFSIVSWQYTTSVDNLVGHGLSSAPEMMIIKSRTTAYNWDVYHPALSANSKRFILNGTTTSTGTGAEVAGFFDTAPTSTVFEYNTSAATNNDNMIAYCFHSVEGFSKIGTYSGNNSADGTFVYTGFRPALVMIKLYNAAGQWWGVYDSARDPDNVVTQILYWNGADAESTYSTVLLDFVSNGFKLRGNYSSINSTYNYLYLAFAESPFKFANAR